MSSHIAWQESKIEKPSGATSEIHRIGKGTILFVEDEDIVREAVSEFLQGLVIRFCKRALQMKQSRYFVTSKISACAQERGMPYKDSECPRNKHPCGKRS